MKKREDGCVMLIYKSGARPQVWDCGLPTSVMWMALRFGTNINHHCTITDEIDIGVQIIRPDNYMIWYKCK